MKLIGFTCAYNEEELIPYVMPYVERLGYDKFVVYNNMSTDRTVELLSKYPFVEIRDWDTNGQFDDDAKCNLQCKSFRECVEMVNESIDNGEEEGIWMSWTDFDEVIYCRGRESFRNTLMVSNDNVFDMEMIDLISEDFPPTEYLAHSYDCVKAINSGEMWNKPVVFLVNSFSYYRPQFGNHCIYVKMRGDYELKEYNGISILSFHLKYLSKTRNQKKHLEYIERNGNTMYKQEDVEKDYIEKLYPFATSVEQAMWKRKNYKYEGSGVHIIDS